MAGIQSAGARRYIDRFMYVIGMGAPLMTVPQIIKIWYYQDAGGVSSLSWAGYAIGSFCWLIYGIVHNEKPLIFANGVAAALQIAVVVGTLQFS